MATPRRIGAALLLALLLAGTQTVAAQGTASFSNTTPILIPGTGTAGGPGAPYPSDITVGGMSGVISDVNVTIRDFSHMWPQDVDILLVSPGGTNMIVLSDVIAASGSQPLANRTYVLDDAGGAFPTTGAPASGVFRPTNSGAGDPFAAPAPTASAATSLASFNGQNPNGVWSLYVVDDASGDIGQIAGGWSIEITTVAAAGSNAVFAVTPNGINFPNAGACTLPGIRRTVSLTMSNSGTGGTVNVLGAVTTGSSAFSVEATSPAPPTFPVALTGATTSVIAVAFQPTAAQTGPQNGTLDISYNIDGGPTLVRSIPFSGQGDAEGAGYVFRSSVVDPACAPGAGTPGTAFVIPATNTRVTTFTSGNLNDGRFNLDLATTYGASFPSFRMYGIDRTVLQLVTNGLVGMAADLSPTSTMSTTFYGALPASGLHSIQVAAMNLNFDATVAADAAGVLGAPGLFHGLADVDADGDQDLVITWWHAYDNGSTPGPSGEYLTAQLILLQANNANEEDIIEMRFLDGNDANAVPFRQNTAVASTDNSMENDAVTGIGEFYAFEAAIYRLRNGTQNAAAATILGGPLYSSGSVGVRFQPETQATATGQAGWRMLGAPARFYQVHRLAQLNLVQGIPGGGFPAGSTNAQTFPGQYPTYGANLYSSYNGTGYVTPTNTAQFLTSGQGFLWYLYNQSFDPADVDGTSNSYALPMALQGTGPEAGLDNGSGSAGVTVHANGNGWNMLANPFRDDLNITNIASWARGGTLASAIGQIWNPNAGGSGSYVLTSAQGNQVSAWQGMMIQNNTTGGATSLTIPTPRIEGAPFVGRAAPPRMVAFALAGQSADGASALVDQAAMLYFAEDATSGWDLMDAGKLTPLAASYATIAFQGERNGNAVLKAQDSRPYDAGAFEVPMAVTAVGTAPELTLTWPTLDGIPATWSLVLRDLVTGATVDLRQQSSYTFTVASARAADLVNGMPPVGAAEARLADTRFVLVVNGATTGNEGAGALPTVFALHNVAPNPVVGVSAALQYDLPEAAATRIEVYDMLGRLVATVVDGQVEAGRHTARLDASALSSGSYVVRMTAGSFVQAQRLTVTR